MSSPLSFLHLHERFTFSMRFTSWIVYTQQVIIETPLYPRQYLIHFHHTQELSPHSCIPWCGRSVGDREEGLCSVTHGLFTSERERPSRCGDSASLLLLLLLPSLTLNMCLPSRPPHVALSVSHPFLAFPLPVHTYIHIHTRLHTHILFTLVL